MPVAFAPALVSLVMWLGSRGPEPPAPRPMPAIRTVGKLGHHLVRHRVLLRRAAIRKCFERHLAAGGPGVKVTFAIDGTGRVDVCNSGPTPLDRCVARVVCRIRFPYAYDTLSDGTRRVTQQLTWVRYRFRLGPGRFSCDWACLRRLLDQAMPRDRTLALAQPSATRPASNQPPQSRPATMPHSRPAANLPQSQPASGPAAIPAPTPTPPPPPPRIKPRIRPGGIPRIPLPQTDDPLEGIKLRKNPLDL